MWVTLAFVPFSWPRCPWGYSKTPKMSIGNFGFGILRCLHWGVVDKVGWALGCSLAAFGVDWSFHQLVVGGLVVNIYRAPTRNTPNCSRSRVEQEGLQFKHLNSVIWYVMCYVALLGSSRGVPKQCHQQPYRPIHLQIGKWEKELEWSMRIFLRTFFTLARLKCFKKTWICFLGDVFYFGPW